MTREQILHMMNTVRGFTLHTVDGLDQRQLTRIPEGCRNNVLWNLGHIACIQCALVYMPSRNPMPIPTWFRKKCYDGTSPDDWDSPPGIDDVLGTLKSLNETICHDLDAGLFEAFRPFDLVPGLTLHDAEEALSFHTVHEGMHLGIIMTLKKAA